MRSASPTSGVPAADSKTDRAVPIPQPTTREFVIVHLGLLTVAMLWGGNFAAIKHLLETLTPVDVVVIRSVGAGVFYGIFLAATGRLIIPMTGPDARRMVFIGVLGIAIMSLAMAYGLNRLNAGLASLLVSSNPIFTAIISRILLGERLTSRKVAGIVVAFVGFLLVLQFGSAGGARLESDQIVGVLIVLLAPLSWAFYTVLSKPLLGRYQPKYVASYTTMAGGTIFVPFLLFDGSLHDRMGELDAIDWVTVLYVSLLAITVAYLLWYWGLRVLTPSQTAVYTYLVPVFGVLASWILLGEIPAIFALVGGVVIVAGVILANTSGRRSKAE
ncbi:MAG TPA: DMT family transporter [Thermomicrobiales bacterium]|nr:DMT family transporter [Thermomicrobiales bacterium]